MIHNFFRILITVILTILGSWLLYFNWPQRLTHYDSYSYTDEESHRLRSYPRAQYAYGMRAWLEQKSERAAKFFKQAVSQNILFLDAWLKLAETEVAMGHTEKATDILTFTTNISDKVFRWKWQQTLLALELGFDEVLYCNANFLLSHSVLEPDTLQLLHTHLRGDTSSVIANLMPEHLVVYLDWLMRWSMTEESLIVWHAMIEVVEPDKDFSLRYSHFLLDQKRITASKEIWQQYTVTDGLTNPGFEKDITGQGFDWIYWGEKDGQWNLKRSKDETAEGEYALKIIFNGRENISFQHIYQIFMTNPGDRYRLTYTTKSQGLTTDQGPFLEIYGYDAKGLYIAGPMITGTQGWSEKSLEFDVPEGCRAAVVRVRRLHSNRFNSKIRGTLWLDDFRLEKIGNESMQFASEKSALPFYRGDQAK